ncbi:MAG: DUF1801 domain-containing protein [Acidipropionibacterium sp.]|jgi:hypothetical protein|nr:DUF1801 domain-containing protein [Acidipropionibacterium sp.]
MPDQIEEFLSRVAPARRLRDARTLLELYGRITGLEPALQGTIIGYGEYHYHYPSGRSGTAPAAAFSPRKAAMSIYLSDGTSSHTDLLARLGPHRAAVGCLYLKDLEQNDLSVLEEIVRSSFDTLTSGTYRSRARDDGADPA